MRLIRQALAAEQPELAPLLAELTQKSFRRPKTEEEHRARFHQTFRLVFPSLRSTDQFTM